mgnify:FL=1
MMYPPKMYRSFLGNTSSVQVKYIICSIKIDDVFYYSTVTAVPQAVTISMLPLRLTVS